MACGPCLIALAGPQQCNPPSDGYQGACSLPTLPGFAIFMAAGALAARRGKRMAGALNGMWGGYLGCALSRAIGVAGDVPSVAMTIGGAWYAARVFDR